MGVSTSPCCYRELCFQAILSLEYFKKRVWYSGHPKMAGVLLPSAGRRYRLVHMAAKAAPGRRAGWWAGRRCLPRMKALPAR